MPSSTLLRSFAACEKICRRRAGNFYPAFRILPAHRRRAMYALYAFYRIADDLSDEPGEAGAKRQALEDWRDGLQRALKGKHTHTIHPALQDTVERYEIPSRYLEASIDGVAMDLTPARYRTFADLRRYCWHVASVVGLSCIHVWGYRGEEGVQLAETAGVAFQITNILRDLGEDAERGRIYLPLDELQHFGCDPECFADGTCTEAFRNLMRFQVQRARRLYEEASPLAQLLQPEGRAIFLAMTRIYRALLDEMERRNYDVFRRRIRVSRWRKLLYTATALPVRFGWPTP